MITKVANSFLDNKNSSMGSDIALTSAAAIGGGIVGNTMAVPFAMGVSSAPVSKELVATDAKIDQLKKVFGKENVPVFKVRVPRSGIDSSAFVSGKNLSRITNNNLLREIFPGATDAQLAAFKQTGVVRTTNAPKLDVLAHEFGHSTGTWNNKFFNFMQMLGRHPAGMFLAPVISGTGTYLRTRNGDDGSSKVLPTAMTVAGALPGVAVVGEEGRASLVGLKKLKEMGVSAVARREARNRLLKALSTYGGLYGGALAVGNGAAYFLAKRHREQSRSGISKQKTR